MVHNHQLDLHLFRQDVLDVDAHGLPGGKVGAAFGKTGQVGCDLNEGTVLLHAAHDAHHCFTHRKMGGVLGYHFIQSFQPGEVTPEQAHAIGLEFAKRLFGKRYEVVISTHLNKHHLHNHLVVNSVSCIDGQKYHSSPESYYNDVRGTSDALCRENDLSVITPQGKGKHYAEWKAEQGDKPTVRGIIRADIDAIIGQAYTYDTFLMLLRKNGYEVRRSPNRKYTTVKPPGAKRAIRLDSLGEGYTEADIMARLSKQRHGGMAPPTVTHAVKHYRVKGKLATVRKKKITGFHALYLRYLYLLRGGRRKKLPPKLPFSVKREVIHLERYEQQFKYLLSSGITTEAELEQRIRVLEWDIRLLEEQRKPLYQERRNTSDEETQAKRRSNSRLPPCGKSAGSCVCAAGYNRTFQGYPNNASRRRLNGRKI